MSERAVVVGAGPAGHMHALAYRAAGVEIAGVFDPDPARAAGFAAAHGTEAAASLGDLLGGDAGFVSVASPPPHHVAQATAAARPRRTGLVEKPVALSSPDLAPLAALAGIVPVVQWRAGRGLRAVRAAVAEGLLGPAPAVSVEMAWGRPDDYFSARATRAAWGCGVLLSVGIHALDAVCWSLDRPHVRVAGALAHARGMEVEDAAAVSVGFQGGAVLALTATFGAAPSTTRLAFTGGGVTAVLEGGDGDPTAAVRWAAADPGLARRLEALEQEQGPPAPPPLLVPFVAAQLGGPSLGLADVVPAHEIAWAVYEAAAPEEGRHP